MKARIDIFTDVSVPFLNVKFQWTTIGTGAPQKPAPTWSAVGEILPRVTSNKQSSEKKQLCAHQHQLTSPKALHRPASSRAIGPLPRSLPVTPRDARRMRS
ncbi:hypothetical protein LLEC1_02290 [Akanthomyces lecanii]|uniref:Uncharacterized protein n=1 Tax=Cordyceps confragosa TaxID=2714763 RepID=A0A179ICB6_CORDF|nr:hypothetical protein LLEC1_02290 [Akanthomyces lecanii]